jgi:hypothetical protein
VSRPPSPRLTTSHPHAACSMGVQQHNTPTPSSLLCRRQATQRTPTPSSSLQGTPTPAVTTKSNRAHPNPSKPIQTHPNPSLHIALPLGKVSRSSGHWQQTGEGIPGNPCKRSCRLRLGCGDDNKGRAGEHKKQAKPVAVLCTRELYLRRTGPNYGATPLGGGASPEKHVLLPLAGSWRRRPLARISPGCSA